MPEPNLDVSPPSDVAGNFADFVLVWQTSDTFVLDFAAITQPPTSTGEDGHQNVHAQVVTRVRIPPSQVFEIMKALEQQLTQWEARTGHVPPQIQDGGQGQ
jgi:hypothetical protein